MAQVRFIGEGETCQVFDCLFHRLEWNGSHLLTDAQVTTLSTNPTFEVRPDVMMVESLPDPDVAPEPRSPD